MSSAAEDSNRAPEPAPQVAPPAAAPATGAETAAPAAASLAAASPAAASPAAAAAENAAPVATAAAAVASPVIAVAGTLESNGNGAAAHGNGNGAASHGSGSNGGGAAQDDGAFWAAAGDASGFDDHAAEQHASKVFALWEIAPALAAPASGASQAGEPGDEKDVWSAAGATEKMDSPPIASHQSALAQAGPTIPRGDVPRGDVATRDPAIAQTRISPMMAMPPAPATAAASRPVAPVAMTVSADMTGDLPALPESRGTRNVLLGALALVVCLVIGGGIAMFSGAGPSPGATTPTAAPPTVATAAPIAPVAAAPAPPAAPAVTTAPATPAPGAATDVAVAVPAAAAPTAPEAPVAPEAAALAPAAPVVAAPVTPAVVAAPEPPPPAPTRRLRVRTLPATATLEVDGQAVANPYDGRLPEGSTHALRARAEGYVEIAQSVDLARDRELTLRLERVPTPRAEPATTARTPRAEPARAEARPRAGRESGSRRPASTIRPRERSSGSSSRGAGFVTESPY